MHLERWPGSLVATLVVAWLGVCAVGPPFIMSAIGRGYHWAASSQELVRGLAVVLGPPALLVAIWQWARRGQRS